MRKLNAGNNVLNCRSTNRVVGKMLGNNLFSVTVSEIFGEKEDLCVFTHPEECNSGRWGTSECF